MCTKLPKQEMLIMSKPVVLFRWIFIVVWRSGANHCLPSDTWSCFQGHCIITQYVLCLYTDFFSSCTISKFISVFLKTWITFVWTFCAVSPVVCNMNSHTKYTLCSIYKGCSTVYHINMIFKVLLYLSLKFIFFLFHYSVVVAVTR
jgi:hypothetical protein